MDLRTKYAVSVAGMALALTPLAGAQLRVVNYNVARAQGSAAALQDVFTALNDDDKPGFAVAPHIYVMQEVTSSTRNTVLTRLNNAAAPLGITYASATYTTSASEDASGGAQAAFYRTDTIVELAGAHLDLSTGAGRETDRWRFRLVGYDMDGSFYIYSSHLKASNTAPDEAERLAGVTTIRTNADTLPQGTHILYAGDFNMYDNLETGYLHWFTAGNGQAVDPLGTGSWANSGNALKHTQSPLLNAANGLVGGGMDDRFDFQLSSQEFHDGLGWTLIAGTYRAFGNDGAHYNQAINTGNNIYYPGDVPRSNALAADLIAASDHIPVVVEYRMPANMTADLPSDFGRVIQGAAVDVVLQVDNVAPATIATGAEILSFNATVSGGVLSGCSDSVGPLDPSAECDLPVDTSTPGLVAGTVTVTTANQGVPEPVLVLNTSGQVVRPSDASFESATTVTAIARLIRTAPNAGQVGLNATLYNRGFDADQSLLDVDGVLGLSAPFLLTGPLPGPLGAGGALLPLAVDTTALAVGDYAATLTVQTSDEDLPGEDTADLTIEVDVIVRILAADVDGNCVVDLDDLLLMLGTLGLCSEDPGYDPRADVDASGCTDLDDLLVLLGAFDSSCP